MSDTELTIALDRYDRHLPLFLNEVRVPGLRYRALEVGMVPPRRHGVRRHARMLAEREFDVAELSLCSYVMAKKQGAALAGIPAFPRRLFSQNHIYVNVEAGIRTPHDLVGRRVGIWAFQVTMSVLAKGDLKSEYGVPWEQIRWVTQAAEEIPWSASGVSIERAPEGRTIDQMLVDGEIDAYIYPHPSPLVLSRRDRVRRLFPDARGESLRYYGKRGYYPIMHLLAVKQERVAERPSLPLELLRLWEASKRLAQELYQDPGYSLLAFARHELEGQEASIGPDPWPSGLAANRANLEAFLAYMVDQRLIDAAPEMDVLFDRSVLDT